MNEWIEWMLLLILDIDFHLLIKKNNNIVLGAGVRTSTHGKGHKEGGLTYAKAGSSLRSSLWKSLSIYPHNHSLHALLLCALTYTSDFTGGCLPPPLSEKELT